VPAGDHGTEIRQLAGIGSMQVEQVRRRQRIGMCGPECLPANFAIRAPRSEQCMRAVQHGLPKSRLHERKAVSLIFRIEERKKELLF
jgi:hypothetical protein